MAIQPLDEIPIDSLIASLPKADLHLHQEEVARLDRVVAGRQGRPVHRWRESAQRLLAETPPGLDRLIGMYAPEAHLALEGVLAADPEYIIDKIVDALEEGAEDGAVLVELRFGVGGMALFQPDFMEMFREAERRAQARHPHFCAEAIGFLSFVNDPERLHLTEVHLEKILKLAGEGLAGVDFIIFPYDTEAAPSLWAYAYQCAERAAEAGLGITVHAGEFSTANLAAAMQVPGLRRLGHATYAAADERLLEQLAQSNVTVECSLSCNVILGAVSSYEEHPIQQFAQTGIPVTLNTDDPVHIWTTIGREYAIAAELGFSHTQLLAFTRNAIKASFTSAERHKVLIEKIDQWETR